MLKETIRNNYYLIDHLTNQSVSRLRSHVSMSKLVAGPPSIELLHDRIIAVHFPKAGGSSLQHQFAQLLRSRLALIYRFQNAMPREPIEFPKGKSMVFGHFHPAVYDNTDGFRMTFLRHPVDNILSIYAFWKSQPLNKFDVLHRKFLEERPSVCDFSKYPGIRNLMSEVYFGGFDMSRFDFIGFHENRNADIKRLSSMIGADLSSKVHCNPTAYLDRDEHLRHDKEIRGRIASNVKKDIAFYEALRSTRRR